MNGISSRSEPLGLTAFELLVALAVAAVVASVGFPALQNVAMNARRLSAVNGFIGAIQFARSTAQLRAETIVLCKADSRLRCSDAVDGARWIVASTTDARPLRVFVPGFPGVILSNRSLFEFRPFPQSSTNGTVSFCDSRGGMTERAVVISRSGRPRVALPASERGLSACTNH